MQYQHLLRNVGKVLRRIGTRFVGVPGEARECHSITYAVSEAHGRFEIEDEQAVVDLSLVYDNG